MVRFLQKYGIWSIIRTKQFYMYYYMFKMKKLINLIALVMLVSTNVFTPFSYAEVETPELIPENEVGNVEKIGETPEKDNEITGEIPNSL